MIADPPLVGAVNETVAVVSPVTVTVPIPGDAGTPAAVDDPDAVGDEDTVDDTDVVVVADALGVADAVDVTAAVELAVADAEFVAATSPRTTGALGSAALPAEPPHPARSPAAHTTITPAFIALPKPDASPKESLDCAPIVNTLPLGD